MHINVWGCMEVLPKQTCQDTGQRIANVIEMTDVCHEFLEGNLGEQRFGL